MAKRTIGTVNKDGISFTTVEVDVKDGEKVFQVQYEIPENDAAFQKWVQGLFGEALTAAYDRYCYAHDLKCRAAERESTSVTLPIISTKKYGKVNLVTGAFGSGIAGEKNGDTPWAGEPLPLANRITAINGAYAGLGEPGKAIQAARAQLLEQKLAREHNGVLRAAG